MVDGLTSANTALLHITSLLPNMLFSGSMSRVAIAMYMLTSKMILFHMIASGAATVHM